MQMMEMIFIMIGFYIQDESNITPNPLCLKVNYTNGALILKDRIQFTLAFTVDVNSKSFF